MARFFAYYALYFGQLLGEYMYQDVLDEIDLSTQKEMRKTGSVELIVVSKTFAVEDIAPILDQGARVFGESKLQEAVLKWGELKPLYDDVKLHLIGPLQSNKTAQAVALFDVIHSVDRKKIADHIALEQNKQNKQLELFIQVNIGDEPQKAGISLAELEGFYQYCVNEKSLNIIGLMCIPPAQQDSAAYFALLHKHAKKLGIKGLSMGMSADFKTAIRLGATHIRVGSAIFGDRNSPKREI